MGILTRYKNKTIQSLDFFQTRIQLKVNGQAFVSSYFGFVISSISIMVVLFCSEYFIPQVPVLETVSSFSPTSYPVSINRTNFTLAVQLSKTTGGITSLMSTANAYFSVGFTIGDANSQTSLGTTQCTTEDQISQFLPNFSQYLCPAYDSNIAIYGGNSAASLQASSNIVVTVSPCQSTVNITCLDPNSIAQLYANSTFKIQIACLNNNFVETEGLQPLLNNNAYSINVNFSKTVGVFYEVSNVEYPGFSGLIGNEQPETGLIIGEENFYDVGMFKTGSFFALKIGISNFMKTYYLNFISFSTFLSKLGGLFKFLAIPLEILFAAEIARNFYLFFATDFIDGRSVIDTPIFIPEQVVAQMLNQNQQPPNQMQPQEINQQPPFYNNNRPPTQFPIQNQPPYQFPIQSELSHQTILSQQNIPQQTQAIQQGPLPQKFVPVQQSQPFPNPGYPQIQMNPVSGQMNPVQMNTNLPPQQISEQPVMFANPVNRNDLSQPLVQQLQIKGIPQQYINQPAFKILLKNFEENEYDLKIDERSPEFFEPIPSIEYEMIQRYKLDFTMYQVPFDGYLIPRNPLEMLKYNPKDDKPDEIMLKKIFPREKPSYYNIYNSLGPRSNLGYKPLYDYQINILLWIYKSMIKGEFMDKGAYFGENIFNVQYHTQKYLELDRLKRLFLNEDQLRLFDYLQQNNLEEAFDPEPEHLLDFSDFFKKNLEKFSKGKIGKHFDKNAIYKYVFNYKLFLELRSRGFNDPKIQQLLALTDQELLIGYSEMTQVLGNGFDLAKTEDFVLQALNRIYVRILMHKNKKDDMIKKSFLTICSVF